MIIIPEAIYSADRQLATIYGNSNDSKPTEGFVNGSVFIETDTLYVYMFDEANVTWRQLA